MQLTEQQIIELKKLVADMVDYQETYLELYDHILTALEQKDDHTELLDAVDAIIDEDFGGYECLFKTEDERQKIVNKQIRKRQWNNFINYFKPPTVILTIAVGCFGYYATNNWWSFRQLTLVLMTLALLPLLVVGARPFITGDWETKSKRSIKDKQIFNMAYSSFWVVQISLSVAKWIAGNDDALADIAKLHSAIMAMLFTGYVVYALSFFKLYRQEFKMQLT